MRSRSRKTAKENGSGNEVTHFFSPIRMVISGPSGAGKTNFLIKLLSNLHVFEPIPPEVYYITHPESIVPNFPGDIKRSDSLAETVKIAKPHSLILLDDLFVQMGHDKMLLDLFIRGSRHSKLNIVYTSQNLYADKESPINRTLNRNASHIVLFKNNRDSSIARNLCLQVSPDKWRELLRIFNTCTNEAYGYCIFDFSAFVHPKLKFKSNLFGENGSFPLCYTLEKDTE